MEKFTSSEIIKLLDSLIGKTEPIGETNSDKLRKENLKNLIEITNWCLDGLMWSASHITEPEWSVRDNAETAYKELVRIKTWCQEIEDEYKLKEVVL